MMSSKSARLEYLRCPSLGVRTMSEYKYVAPYTGQPFTDRYDCCGNWQGHIIHVATNGWRYCDRCTDHHSFGTEGVV